MEHLNNLNTAEKQKLIALLKEKKRRDFTYRYRGYYETRYPWQRDFIARTAEYSQVALIAANRVGKTDTATYIDSVHLLGEYPEGWEGHKFTHPPLVWCLGYSGEKCRDLLQKAIIGEKIGPNTFSGGLIPPERIVSTEPMTGTPNAIRSASIRHSSGELSKIQFWSYTQGQHALMGDNVDWFHIDEEPEDALIWPQVLTRTASGDRGQGGRGILTFTPENGRTELVVKFMEDPAPAQTCMNVGWNDAPHLTEKVKSELLASYPVYQKKMRTEGIPMLGHGLIYQVGEEAITCDPFPIPLHFMVINGQDFGWDHPQSHVQLAIDMDNDIIYVTRAWSASKTSPDEAWAKVKAWADGIPVAWPQDGLQTEKGSGKQQMSYYAEAGFSMLEEFASWPDGSRSVEAGLFEIYDLMLHGKFKIFAGLRPVFDEINRYHRDEKGKIVKKDDDVLDAIRYAYMMRRFAIYYGEMKKPRTVVNPSPIRPIARGR